MVRAGVVAGLLAAVMLVGAAAAAKPTCTSGTALSVSSVGKPTCVKNSGTATVKLTISPMDAQKKIKVVVWNSGRVASWGASAPTFDAAAMGVQGGAAKVSASQTSTSFYVKDIAANGDCAGVHDIVMAEAGEWSVMALSDYTVSPGMIAPTKSVSVELLASEAGASAIAFGVDADFAKMGYMVSQATVTTDYAATVALQTKTGTSMAGTKTGMVTKFTPVENVDAGEVQIQVTLDALTATEYDWKTNGPFITAKVTFTSLTEYDMLPTSGWTKVTIPAAGSPKVYIAKMSQFWRMFTLMWSLDSAGAGAGYGQSAHIKISSTSKTIAGISTSSLKSVNPAFDYSGTDVRSLSNLQLLSSALVSNSGFFYVKFEKDATCKATITNDAIYIKGVVDGLGGECPTGYAACHKIEADHPSSKAATSANGMSNRMRSCMLVPSVEDPSVATTKCVECSSDCDCGESQYCHLDPGVCRRTDGTYYNCDSDSNRQLGLCVAKDPTGDVLGQPCRTDVGQSLDAGNRLVNANNPNRQLLVAESVAEAEAAESLISAASFCGGVRFYNTTAPGSVSASQADTMKANAARAILWRGSCVNHMCMECSSGQSRCGDAGNNPASFVSNGVQGSPSGYGGSSQRCINGAWMPNLIVDGTQRTFGLNTVAGTMLAGVFMIILLQGCTCIRIYQEYVRAHPKASNPAITAKTAA